MRKADEGADGSAVLAIGDIDKIASSTISTKGALTAINAATTLYNQEVGQSQADTVASATGKA